MLVQFKHVSSNPRFVVKGANIHIDTLHREQCVLKDPVPLSSLTDHPPYNDHFVGRTEQLAELRNKLSRSATRQPVVIFGEGGMGKTQLAIQLGVQELTENRAVFYRHILAETVETLYDAYRSLALDAQLIQFHDPINPEAVTKIVNRYLENNPGWIIVYDNVDNDASREALKNFIPNTGGKTIITSRLSDWVQNPAIRLDRLPVGMGVRLLSQITQTTQSDFSILEDQLSGLPLALTQAARYMVASPCSAEAYLQKLVSDRRLLLDSGVPEDHVTSIRSVWRLTKKAIRAESETALNLVRRCVFLNGDQLSRFIIGVLLWQLTRNDQNHAPAVAMFDPNFNISDNLEGDREAQTDPSLVLDLNHNIRVLTKYGVLIKTNTGYRFHRLNQDTEYSELNYGNTIHTHFSDMIQAISGRFFERSHDAISTLTQRLVPHLDAIVGHSLALAPRLFKTDLSDAQGVIRNMANYLFLSQNDREGGIKYQNMADQISRCITSRHLSRPQNESDFENPLVHLRVEGYQLLFDAFGIQSEVRPLGSEAPSLWGVRFGGVAPDNPVELDRSEGLLKKALEIFASLNGAEAEFEIRAHIGLGDIAVKRAKLDNALAEYQTALQIDHAFFGVNSPTSPETHSRIATLHFQAGRYQDALQSAAVARSVLLKYIPDDKDPRVGVLNLLMGRCHKQLNHVNEGDSLIQQGIDALYENLADPDPRNLDFKLAIAKHRLSINQFEQAETMLIDILQTIFPKIVQMKVGPFAAALHTGIGARVGIGHFNRLPDNKKLMMASCCESLGIIHLNRKEFFLASDHFSASWAITSQVFGPNHPNTVRLKNMAVRSAGMVTTKCILL